MLYVPGYLLFIHVPRTAGMSITETLAEYFAGTPGMVVGINNHRPYERHARAGDLKPFIKDWDRIQKFAFERPRDEIIFSDYQLHQRDFALLQNEPCDPEYWESLELASMETLDEFARRRWSTWIGNKEPIDYFSNAGGVVRYRFADLDTAWARITKKIGAPGLRLKRSESGVAA
jgi:hypothetical protein